MGVFGGNPGTYGQAIHEVSYREDDAIGGSDLGPVDDGSATSSVDSVSYPESVADVALPGRLAWRRTVEDELRAQPDEPLDAVEALTQLGVQEIQIAPGIWRPARYGTRLTPREILALTLFFGLGLDDCMQKAEIARVMGVTRANVSRFISKALAKLARSPKMREVARSHGYQFPEK